MKIAQEVINERVALVNGWFEGHPQDAIIEELAAQWILAEQQAQ